MTVTVTVTVTTTVTVTLAMTVTVTTPVAVTLVMTVSVSGTDMMLCTYNSEDTLSNRSLWSQFISHEDIEKLLLENPVFAERFRPYDRSSHKDIDKFCWGQTDSVSFGAFVERREAVNSELRDL